ncbi:hypothetical protein J7T55_009975 [Diaporthe amygdali]|uniref:uncharacterized protein n=1 Tax=Phomopsis amygdali TaxID=1214568 RepID=UPI0022FDFF01|nr:uncharacterized protein J7T55_009975 [Diaporthe amygdali]KAJ0116824.1 hypothetical protein J7T55_009975 [Diaporthe amygdali]
MVALDKVQQSNAQIATTYPAGLVAVFAGATAGIGETSLREFARHTAKPRIYIVGRSKEACDRLEADLREVNPEGQYTFIRSDVSLLRNVDDVCKQIREKESEINVLFMSQGTLNFSKQTEEGMSYLMSLTYFGRLRMAKNLLPLLQRATGLRRVVSSFTGAKEGKVFDDDWQGKEGKIPFTAARGHGATMMTLGLEALAKEAPEVSFIHAFPGKVKTDIIRSDDGAILRTVAVISKALFFVTGWTPIVEVGERHTFYCTSARFPPKKVVGEPTASGVQLPDGMDVARGVDGGSRGGVYSVDTYGDSADEKIEEVLANYRRDGTAEKLWKYTESEWQRVTGTLCL